MNWNVFMQKNASNLYWNLSETENLLFISQKVDTLATSSFRPKIYCILKLVRSNLRTELAWFGYQIKARPYNYLTILTINLTCKIKLGNYSPDKFISDSPSSFNFTNYLMNFFRLCLGQSESSCTSDDKRKLFCAWDSSKSKCLTIRDAKNNVCCQKKPLEGCNDLMKGRCPEQYQVNFSLKKIRKKMYYKARFWFIFTNWRWFYESVLDFLSVKFSQNGSPKLASYTS